MRKSKKKVKYLNPKMRWNSGTMSYEPDVKLINQNKKESNKSKLSWLYLILIILGLILFLILLKIFG